MQDAMNSENGSKGEYVYVEGDIAEYIRTLSGWGEYLGGMCVLRYFKSPE